MSRKHFVSTMIQIIGLLTHTTACGTNKNYDGTWAMTKTGKVCQRWDTQFLDERNRLDGYDDKFPEKNVTKAHNYCRNPRGSFKGPWCYFLDEDGIDQAEECDVPWCTGGLRDSSRLEGQAKIIRETKLREYLMHGYHSDVAPPYDEALQISLNYTLLKIIELDEKREQLQTTIHLTVGWHDPRLVWNYAEQYPQIDFALREVWSPPIVLFNSVFSQHNLFQKGARVYVQSNGWLETNGVFLLTSPCQLDVTRFPLDLQVCEQNFRILPFHASQRFEGHVPSEIDISGMPKKPLFMKDSIWSINRTRDVEVFQSQEGNGQAITLRLRLTRKYQYYLGKIMAPVMIISSLVMLVFFIPPDAGEKIPLGITLLLTFSFFQITIDEDLPATSDSTPLITVAMILLQICSAVSIGASILVLNIHHFTTIYSRHMPMRVRHLMFNILSHLTCHRTAVVRTTIGRESCANAVHPVDESKALEKCSKDVLSSPSESRGGEKECTSSAKVRVESLLVKILGKLEEEDHDENEWKLAALILDRVLMYLCLIAMIVVYASFFVQLTNISNMQET